jgi:hypothetical protein
MEFKEFVSKIYPVASDGCLYNPDKDRRAWHDGRAGKAVKAESEVTRETELRGREVSTGGMSGGGYGEDCASHAYVNDNPGPIELLELDAILEVVWPEITYLQYKALVREAGVKTESYTVNEYYGNSTNYVYMTVKLGDLYKAICLRG